MEVPVGDTESEFSLFVRPRGLYTVFHILGARRHWAAEGSSSSRNDNTWMIAQNLGKDRRVVIDTSAVLCGAVSGVELRLGLCGSLFYLHTPHETLLKPCLGEKHSLGTLITSLP